MGLTDDRLDVAPFRGVRYDPAVDLTAVTAPPYDAIDATLAVRLRVRSPVNVVRLELGAGAEASEGGRDRYAAAADTYRRWRADGVLVADAAPTVTVYSQRVPTGEGVHEQRGLLVALGLRPWGQGVLPHERVFPSPVEDRLRLLEALPVNVSPVYLVAEQEPPQVAALLDTVTATQADTTFTDPDDGVEHRLWCVTDRDTLAPLSAGYADAELLMADGHHRYTTGLEYLTRHPRRAGADAILAYVVGGDGPLVRPMHRLVRRWPPDARRRMRDAGVELVPAHRDELTATVTSGSGTFGVLVADGAFLARATAASDMLRPEQPELHDLDAALVQALLVGPLGVPDRVEELVYTPDAEAAAEEVAAGHADALVIVPPVPLPAVRAAARAGLRMPPKTTSFVPKPRTGVVLRPLGD